MFTIPRYQRPIFYSLVIAIFTVIGGIGLKLYSQDYGYEENRPAFYLATDKSFSKTERAYVNLEGPGNVPYEFRIYKIRDPKNFVQSKVTERIVKDENNGAFGNPVTMFKQSWMRFKKDFRTIARKEFNSKTRSQLKKITGVNLDSNIQLNHAVAKIKLDQDLLFTFSIPETKDEWSYRRVPIPADGGGIFLVETVSGANIAYTVIVKSDIHFLTKQSEKETLVYAANRITGAPEKAAEITIIDSASGLAIASGSTDQNGVYKTEIKTPTKTLVFLKKNEEYTISDSNFYSTSFYGEGGLKAFVHTDRPIYKPGDEVNFRGIVRNFVKNDYSLTSGSGTVDILTEEGTFLYQSLPVQISVDMGTFQGNFILPNSKDQFLGLHNIILNFHGKSFSTEFTVEAYRKPQFFVKLVPDKNTYALSDSPKINIHTKYFFGEPVAEGSIAWKVFRKLKFDYSPVGQIPYFEDSSVYLGYKDSSGSKELVSEGKGELNKKGEFDFKIKLENINSDFEYSAIATVTSSLDIISGSTSFSVNRSPFYLKIERENMVYSPGETAKVKVTLLPFDKTLSADEKKNLMGGKKVTATMLTRSFFAISREGERKEIESKSEKSNEAGIVEFEFKIPESGHFILDFKSESTSAETTLWASAKTDSIQFPFKNLTIKTNKDIYQAGEEADILILSPAPSGYLFITFEANNIIKYETIESKGNAYKYRIKIDQSMSPNFTLSVSQFFGNEVYKSETKIVVPPVEKFLRVVMDTDKKIYKPGDEVTLQIQTSSGDKKGVSTEVSIAVVDEAIFALKEDQNPSLSTYFYHPRRNNIQTSISTSYKFFGYSEARKLKLADLHRKTEGFSAIKDDDPKSRENFKDTTFWKGKTKTDVSGKATIKFRLADNLTTWRVTAIAISANTSVGQGTYSFIAKKDLSIIGSIPKYLLKGEEQIIVANLSNVTSGKINSEITIETKNARVIGENKKSILLNEREKTKVVFKIKPEENQKTDDFAEVILKIKGGALSDSVKYKIPLKLFGKTANETLALKFNAGEDTAAGEIIIPTTSLNPKLVVRLSPGYGDALRQSLSYLSDYPYGCIEQTMSKFMPLLAAKKTGFISTSLDKQLPKMIEAGLFSIIQNQNADGGFGWYADANAMASDPLMTAYVYRGLAILKKTGIKVDDSLLTKTRSYLYLQLKSANFTPMEKIYILYSLSEGGKLEASLVVKLSEQTKELNAYGKAMAGMIYFANGNSNEASTLWKQGMKDAKLDKREIIKFVSILAESSWEKDQVETTSSLLLLAVRLGEDKEAIDTLAMNLIYNRTENAWKNSRDTASAVIALSESLEKYRQEVGNAKITLLVNGHPAKEMTVSPNDLEENLILEFNSQFIKAGENKFKIVKEDGPPLFATLNISFTDSSKIFLAKENGIILKKEFYKIETERVDGSLRLSKSKSKTFRYGDLVMIEMEVTRQGKTDSYFQIDDYLPPGLLVDNQDREYYSSDFPMEYDKRQLYDDRSVFFVSGPKAKFTLRYFVRAAIPGKYKVMPSIAKLMYFPEVTGSDTDHTIEIRE